MHIIKRLLKYLGFAYIKNVIKISLLRSKFGNIKNFYVRGEKNKKVLFFSVRNYVGSSHLYFDSIMAHALNLRGENAKIIICDNILSNCDCKTCFSEEDLCVNCNKYRKKLISALDIPILKFSDFIDSRSILQFEAIVNNLKYSEYKQFAHKGFNLGGHAECSTIRYFLRGLLEDNIATRKIFKGNILNAMISLHVAEEANKLIKPDIVVMSHGLYSTWGPAFDYFRREGLNVLIHAKGPTDYVTQRFNWNNYVTKNIAPIYWEGIKKRKLNQKEKTELMDFMSKRKQYTSGDLRYYRNKIRIDEESKIDELASKRYIKRFAMFTNLAWDTSLVGTNNVFGNLFDWVRETIEYFCRNSNFLLIVKLHPAELAWEKNTISVGEYIKSHFINLPENIVILKPDTSISAYDLFPCIDMGIVYNGTLGLELAVEGIPVLVVGNCHYSMRPGIVYPISSKDEYFSAINNISIVKRYVQDNIENIYRYAHLYFIKYDIPMPFLSEKRWAEPDLKKIRVLKDLLIHDKTINYLCDCILEGKEILRQHH